MENGLDSIIIRPSQIDWLFQVTLHFTIGLWGLGRFKTLFYGYCLVCKLMISVEYVVLFACLNNILRKRHEIFFDKMYTCKVG